MSPTLDIGIRFIVEPGSFELSEREKQQLAELRPAGVMLRRRNFKQDAPYAEWLASYTHLLEEIRKAIGRDRIVVSVDHEGGQVHRFPAPITRFPYPAFYAAEISAVEAVGQAMGEELQSLGVNISFSPTADIHSNPQNPVINQRAFGTTVDAVVAAVCPFARALRAAGIIPCAKHFPGHGDTSTDSHVALPCVDRSLEQLMERELKPFQALIADGIEMIMSAHIVLPQIDPSVPATLSHEVMTNLLRSRLGFKGITIADALGMKGVAGAATSDQLGVKAHRAGIDLLLMVGDTVTLDDALVVKKSLESYGDSESEHHRSLQTVEKRLRDFLSRLPQYPCGALSEQSLASHGRLAAQLGKNSQWAHFNFNPVGFT